MSFRRAFGAAWLLLFLLCGAWAMATPVSGAPDEPSHLIKAASVVRGQLVGEPSDLGHVVQVPRWIAATEGKPCFAHDPEVSAACTDPPKGDPSAIIDGATTAGLYNPLYYAIVGWPSLLAQDESGIYAMRLVSAAASTAFLALGFALVCGWRRPGIPLLGVAIVITPMILFLGGIVNPNSLETAGVFAAFVAMLDIVLHPNSNRLASRAAIVLVSAAVAVNTRGLSPLWVAVALLSPLVLARSGQLASLLRRTSIRVAIAGVAVSTALALIWIRGSGSLAAGIDSPSENIVFERVGESPFSGFLTTLEQTFSLGQGMIGVFGWLDTPAPDIVYFAWSVAVGGAVLAALVLLRGRHLAIVLLLLACVIVMPALIQAAYITGGGFIWQGRYTLPAFVCLVIAIGAALADRIPQFGGPSIRRLTLVALAVWAVGHSYSFLFALKRFGVGTDRTWGDLVLRPEWVPPGGVLLWPSVFVATVTVTAGLMVWLVIRAGDRADAEPEGTRTAQLTPPPAPRRRRWRPA